MVSAQKSHAFESARHFVAKQRFLRLRKSWQLLIEKIYRAIDKRFDQLRESAGSLTTDVRQMRQSINDLVIDQGNLGRFAPHHFTIKINHTLYVHSPARAVRALEDEILAEAIDYINDNRYHTFAPIKVQLAPEVFADGVKVEPGFGELEKVVRRKTARASYASEMLKVFANTPPSHSAIVLAARFSLGGNRQEEELVMVPGSSRLNVGRAPENDFCLDHPSVSVIHAVLTLDTNGRLLVADSGSMTGTFINGRRILPGTAKRVTERDVLSFGDVQVRIRRSTDQGIR